MVLCGVLSAVVVAVVVLAVLVLSVVLISVHITLVRTAVYPVTQLANVIALKDSKNRLNLFSRYVPVFTRYNGKFVYRVI